MTTVLDSRLLGDVLRDILRPFDLPPVEDVATRRRLARTLLSGRDNGSFDGLALAYAVIAFCASTEDDAARVLEALRDNADALVLDGVRGGYVLLPCAQDGQLALARDLHARLGLDVWMGVVWASRRDLAAARATAEDVLRVASCRAPGVYELRNVLADFAVLRRPHVAERLVRVIEPVVAQQPLLDALRAFIAEDGNRAAAARRLDIHRSTLDHRLRLIERLTGCRPTSPRALLTLSVALTAHSAPDVPLPRTH
ncbi:PucR C-terminal helix-turn-helix domain-containing protein [Lentzea waywayandensis]|uniref:PucR C-terminal helix-turn-helix domain-containing protein n=1 Tax=Lentzea waywayandensis TaxID=84724 RepID=A0A1I6D006_9PSEU|nr:PucR family transcriptional regulator [Lentzea waywayandensis]SFQ98819.1 PucR C-terminal helix-turn-helix domain-containing protein [Lentzea waywayandensis]